MAMNSESTSHSTTFSKACVIASLILFIAGSCFPSYLMSPKFSSRLFHAIFPLVSHDPIGPQKITLINALDRIQNGNLILSIFGFLTLFAFPIVTRVLYIFDIKSDIIWMSLLRGFSLPLIWCAAIILLSLNSPQEGAQLQICSGWYFLVASELLFRISTYSHTFSTVFTAVSDASVHFRALAWISGVLLIIGVLGPIVHFSKAFDLGHPRSLLDGLAASQETFSIVTGVAKLRKAGLIAVSYAVIAASIVFPVLKTGIVLQALYGYRQPQFFLKAASIGGPLSMLDTLLVIVLIVAYAEFPFGSRVTSQWAIWFFTIAILSNSIIAYSIEHRSCHSHALGSVPSETHNGGSHT